MKSRVQPTGRSLVACTLFVCALLLLFGPIRPGYAQTDGAGLSADKQAVQAAQAEARRQLQARRPQRRADGRILRSPAAQAAFEAERLRIREAALRRLQAWPVEPKTRGPEAVPASRAAGIAVTFTVNTAYDDPDNNPGDGICYSGFLIGLTQECTLRAAIDEANATAGTDPVQIDLDLLSPARGGVPLGYDGVTDTWTIQVNTTESSSQGPLPPVTRANVVINGEAQQDGSGAGTFSDAFCGDPVNFTPHVLKVMIDGSLLENQEPGLEIQGADVQVQGLAVGNAPGPGIYGNGSDGLTVECVHVGTDLTGMAAAGNGGDGVLINATGNVTVRTSVISGNGVTGLAAVSSDNPSTVFSYYGLNANGSAALGNVNSGVYLSGTGGNIQASVISGNDTGVWLDGTGAGLVTSIIGLNRDQNGAIPNRVGVYVNGSDHTVADNAIAGNSGDGVFLTNASSGNTVRDSFIGTSFGASGVFGNGADGVADEGAGNRIGTAPAPPEASGKRPDEVATLRNTDGTRMVPPASSASNVISGNADDGIELSGTDAVVQGNYVGTNADGSAAIANAFGIYLDDGSGHQIGGTAPGAGNLVSGNTNFGIGTDATLTGVVVEGNYIGTDAAGLAAVPNGEDGIRAGSQGVIGGTAAGAANVIAFNGEEGVEVFNSSAEVSILGNRIYANGTLGIDLSGNGVTPNDTGSPPDTDAGPNGLQNYPDLGNLTASGGSVSLNFELRSTPNTTFRVELFTSSTPDPSDYGEGATFVQAIIVNTNGDGLAFFSNSFAVSSFLIGRWVTATATPIVGGIFGGTSEFSEAVQVMGPSVTLSNGQVFLEGPYAGGGVMANILAAAGDVPLAQPYNDPMFNGTLLEVDDVVSAASLPANTVDWIVVSLRTSPAAADEVARRVAFVQSDGLVRKLDGGAAVEFFGVVPGSYYVVVCHRNHLCAMSASAVDFTGGTGTWDFTTGLGQAYAGGGIAMKVLGGGVFGLFSSDGNADGEVTALDFNLYNAATTAGATGYRREDFNLDGNVTALDFNPYNANTTAGASSQVPDP